MLLDPEPPIPSHLRQLLGLRREGDKRSRPCLDVTRRKHQACSTVHNDVRNTADSTGQYGPATGRCFQADIRKTFGRNLLTKGAEGDDPVSQVVRQLMASGAALEGIRDALVENARARETPVVEPASDGIDLTKVAISRETLQRIWELIEADKLRAPEQSEGTLNLRVPDRPAG